jgi:hypothetical protein
MKFRKLRIAWSVLCGFACLLLIALWARSYWWADIVAHKNLGIMSNRGMFYFGQDDSAATAGWFISSEPSEPNDIGWNSDPPGQFFVCAPHWLLALTSVAIGAASWIRRFSLRTLLIATTLVAVMLGLIVYVTRQ